MSIIVIGGGVVGFGAALKLLESGYKDVTIVARDFSPHTTSDAAGGLWRPFGVESQPELGPWGRDTLRHLLETRRDFGSQPTGIGLFSGYELFAKKCPDPDWTSQVLGFRSVDADELKLLIREPGQRYTYGWFYTTAIVDSSVYLPWLTQRFKALGGKLQQREVRDLSEFKSAALVVNCAGLGARTLVKDELLHPVRGQIIRVKAPSVHHFWSCDDDEAQGKLMYILPRNTNVVLGGTYQSDDTNMTPTKQDAKHIMDSCSGIVPELRSAVVEKEYVGLRPSRPTVRLELERKSAAGGGASALPPIIHCYGHGGSGITLHWGCGVHVARLAKTVLPPPPSCGALRAKL